MDNQMWFVAVVQIRNGERELVSEFVCADEARANFLAGQAIDELSDFTGLEYDYGVAPVAVKS